ncbi:WhiB family transcriptional regulator [Microbacterium sp. MAHUQ-60]|uniref:WhiB family transcriptional regulator n=1 Tax=unclassified Microbacterium TaxID=2609290 RepID=UPI0036084313
MSTRPTPTTTNPELWARLLEALDQREIGTPQQNDLAHAAATAFAALNNAMSTTRPACLGDARFTADHLTAQDIKDLRTVCASCPLADTCGDYASAAFPPAGFWAGTTWKEQT